MPVDPAAFTPPMLACPGTVPEVREGFAYEFKWDGVRIVAGVSGGTVRLWSRRGNDATPSYPELVGLVDAVPDGTVLDGEVVAFDAQARPSFSRLQRRMHVSDPGRARVLARSVPVALMVFDVLAIAGEDLTGQAYEQRRARLEELRLQGTAWRVPPSRTDDVEVILGAVGQLQLEGIVAKRLGSTYRPGQRSDDWRKLRIYRRQELVVGGYRTGEGRREGSFGSLLLGYHDDEGRLRFAGSVGSGFTERELARLRALLAELRTDASPFVDPVPHRDAVFVRPELVAEVQFSEWTPEGVLRQPSYKGLRDDKDPREVVRDD